ncbi:flagellar motor stator protein MotA [Geovibrio ferrireducens]|uniref:flagellar motor stator protein MotA n=1 Tax=Geovibrio ferrireducens TaxID=46201 RepID=UPI0022481CDC|nr:flagellar motor stator protein MotA [Geovibrio ferrireducens]
MEKSTVIGLILGFVAVGVGMVFKGASLTFLLNPAAFLIIFVGTAATLFIGFPMKEISKFPVLLGIIMKGQKHETEEELIRIFTDFAGTARKSGLLSLEGRMDEVHNPYMRKGLSLIIDGRDPEFVQNILQEDISAMEERHQMGAQIFTQAGTYAPTLGVLGAVIGLVAALGNLNDIEKLGHSIAAAFIATLMGIFSGYVLWHPFANKLKRFSKHEAELKKMIFEGITALQAGDSASTVEEKLNVFLPQKKREKPE